MFGRHLLLLGLALTLSVATSATPAAGPQSRDALIDTFSRKATGPTPLTSHTGQVRHFTLEVHRVRTEVSPGVTVEQWAYSRPGEAPSVPGPELRVQQGDLVRITLVNTHDQPHTIHSHGITSLAQDMDGVPHTSFAILPGRSYTYEFVATEAGTHAYHCHQQTNVHLDMGMYGALIVEPAPGVTVPWKAEHTLILDEWASRQDPASLKHDLAPDLFLVNGRTFPLIPDVTVPAGQLDLLRVIHMGAQPHSLHLHGLTFLVIAKDGHDLPAPYEADTLPILPGERYDLLVKGREGQWPFHDHNTVNNVNLGQYPGGQHLMLSGSPARTTPAAGHDHHPPASPASSAPATTPVTSVPTIPSAARPAGAPLIRLKDFEFSPASLTVNAGDTVYWKNDDTVAHHLVLTVAGREEVHALPPGGEVGVTFTQPGSIRYRCQPHPFMQGVVQVK